MDLDEIFNTFLERVVRVELFRSVVTETTPQVLTRFAELARAEANQAGDVLPRFMSVRSMGFRDPESGDYVRYGATTSRAEDRVRQVIRQQDRQYGWLLVEAYEEFEDFLEKTYAWLGKHDSRAWRDRERGSIQCPEASQQPFSRYLETLRNTPALDPRAILGRLRHVYPILEETERQNKLNRNLRLSVELIANLRHKIVHARGTISNRNGFVEQVLKNCGLWNNGRPTAENREAVEAYLSPDPDCFITLIEVNVPPPPDVPPGIWRVLSPRFDTCGWLIEDLVADAVLIHRCVSSHTAATPTA